MDSTQIRRAVRAVLGESEDGRRGDEPAPQEAAFAQEELDAMLAEWEEKERPRVTGLLTAALAAAAIAGFVAAFKEWGKKLGMELTPKASMLDKLRAWAQQRAAELFSQVSKSMRRGAEDVVRQGDKDGASHEEIRRRLRKFFGDPKKTTERAQDVANEEEKNAHNRGKLDANQALGAKTKVWITAGDGRVCDKCRENAAAGAISIYETFPSGHAAPPAHKRCRCEALYDGVERDWVFDLFFS